MLQDAYIIAKIGADTAENERNFAEILPKIRKIRNHRTGTPSGARSAKQGAMAQASLRTRQPVSAPSMSTSNYVEDGN